MTGKKIVSTCVCISIRSGCLVRHRFAVDVVGSDCVHDEEVLGPEVSFGRESASEVHMVSEFVIGAVCDQHRFLARVGIFDILGFFTL